MACASGAVGSAAGDLEDLRGAGEVQIFGGGQDFDEALFKAAVLIKCVPVDDGQDPAARSTHPRATYRPLR